MATPTKQDLIDELQSLVDELQLRLKARVGKIDTRRAEIDRAREKIGKLKDVARFYRAQRDRVDAYLSAMIDAAELQSPPKTDVCDRGISGTTAFSEPPAVAHGRRPRVQEPSSTALHQDGRAMTPYRDQEPAKDWEDF